MEVHVLEAELGPRHSGRLQARFQLRRLFVERIHAGFESLDAVIREHAELRGRVRLGECFAKSQRGDACLQR